MKFLLILICFCSISVIGQNTFVPDDNFEQALIDLGYDPGPLDNLVPTQNIENINILFIGNRGIFDLTGIEDFVGLIRLNADDNNLTSVDLSGNVNIKTLAINRSGLLNINLSNNTLLESLTLDNNQLSEIDVSNNTELTLFHTNFNQLESLSIENNSKIISLSSLYNNITSFSLPENNAVEFLRIAGNPLEILDITSGKVLSLLDAAEGNLSQLDLSQNANLTALLLNYNNIESIDVTNNTLLNGFLVDNNPLLQLDLSQNPALRQITFGNTKLESINLSFNKVLQFVDGKDNLQLCTVDIRNENNTLIMEFFYLTNCPLLKCVLVDDVLYSQNTWSNIDVDTNYVTSEEDCESFCCPVDFDFNLTLENITTENNQIQINLDDDPLGFLYSLDTNNNYQQESIFFNVPSGSHTIYVIDINGCLEKSIEVFVENVTDFYIPKFFTPNGDGIKDLWKIIDSNNAVHITYIFNRYGKLLKTLSPNSSGWDGIYNGAQLPVSDYWYKISLKSGEQLNGHFSLKR